MVHDLLQFIILIGSIIAAENMDICLNAQRYQIMTFNKITYTTARKPHLLYDPHYEKPAFCLREKHTEAADQLCGNRTADQILCFRDIDSRIPKLAKFEISRYAVRFLTDLFGNPNDAFFRDVAQIKVG